MFTKLLVPLDGTELSEGVLPYVSRLAESLDAQILVLSVIEPSSGVRPGTYFFGSPEALDSSETRVETDHQEIVRRLANEGVRAQSIVVAGYSAETIVRVAEREGCDLIAMATHGRRMLGRVFQGGVTDEVVRSSPVPVLAINPPIVERYSPDGGAITRIIVPLDGSPFAEQALPYAEGLARKLQLEITLARVIDTGAPYTGVLDDARFVQVDDDVKAAAATYLKKVAEDLEGKGLKVRTELASGNAPESLVDIARRTPEDIIVMTSHGRSGLARWMEGSVAESLIRSSGDPVLIVPPPVAAEALIPVTSSE